MRSFSNSSSLKITKLAAAVIAGDEVAVRIALDSGANIDARNAEGITSLHMAVISGDLAMCKLLLERHASVDIAQTNGTIPLHHAARKGNATICKLLLDNGANVNTVRHDGCSSLYIAALKGRAAVIELLLSYGAYHFLANASGITPLMAAAANGCARCVTLLLNAGADAARRSRIGKTPLQIAEKAGHVEAAAVLREWLHQQPCNRTAAKLVKHKLDPMPLFIGSQPRDNLSVSVNEMEAMYEKGVTGTQCLGYDPWNRLRAPGLLLDLPSPGPNSSSHGNLPILRRPRSDHRQIQLQELIGQSSNSAVYRARCDQRDCVVKCIPLCEELDYNSVLSMLTSVRRAMERKHSAFVPVRDIYTENNELRIVMDLCDKSLDILAGSPQTNIDALSISLEV